MEKSIGLVLIAVYGMWFFMGQNTNVSTEDVVLQEIRIMEDTTKYRELTQSQMHNMIKSVSEENGWEVTKFKSNALIAEKVSDNGSKAVTITFSKSEFSISPKNRDLQKAIDSALRTS